MKSVYEIRRENLRSLIGQWGGPTSLSRKLGHSNGSYVAQLAGPRPSREVSERVAREIENKLGLPVCVKCVATVLRDAGLRPDPGAYATLVQLTYERSKLTGRIEESYVQKLIQLIQGSGT
jgi:hypothetical protein